MPIKLEPLDAIGPGVRGDEDIFKKITRRAMIRRKVNVELGRLAGSEYAIRKRCDSAATRRLYSRDMQHCIPAIAEEKRALRRASVGNRAEIRCARIDQEDRAMFHRRTVRKRK